MNYKQPRCFRIFWDFIEKETPLRHEIHFLDSINFSFSTPLTQDTLPYLLDSPIRLDRDDCITELLDSGTVEYVVGFKYSYPTTSS